MALCRLGVCRAASELAGAVKLDVEEYEVWADQVLEEELWRSTPRGLSRTPHLIRVGDWVGIPKPRW